MKTPAFFLLLGLGAAACGGAVRAREAERPMLSGPAPTCSPSLCVMGDRPVSSNETSVAWAPAASHPYGTFMVGYMAFSGARAAWAVATNPNDQWVARQADWPGAGWPLPPATATADGSPGAAYSGDPTVLGLAKACPPQGCQAGPPTDVFDRFAYSNLLHTRLTRLDDVVIALSTNAGQSFDRVDVVTDPRTGGQLPTFRSVDRPAATVDPVTGEIWMYWAQGLQHGPTANWVRMMWYDNATPPAFHATDPLVMNGLPITPGQANIAVSHPPGGQVELHVVYPSVFGPRDCAKGAGPQANTYFDSVSSDRGQSWRTTPIATDRGFKPCLGPALSNAFKNEPRPAVAVNGLTGEVSVALTRSQDSGLGMAVEVWRTADRVRWTRVFTHPATGPGVHDQWGQSMAFIPLGPRGKLGVAWHDTRDDAAGNQATSIYATTSNDGGDTWAPATLLSKSAGPGQIPWVPTAAWGDYEGMVGNPLGYFVAAWADQRMGPTAPATVWAGLIKP